jgi:type IV secretion system protein VirB6
VSTPCATLVDDGIVRGVLATVQCQTRAYAEGGYVALTSGSSVFQTALTALLTIYIALVGYRLLFAQGEARISDAPLIALKIGVILALVTSWSTFQTMVFDLADRAPVEIAAIVSAPLQESGSGLASRPVDGLQAAYDEFSNTGAAYGRIAGPDAKGYSSPQAAAAETTAAASGVLFFMTAGVISASTLAIGVLTALGPIFIAFALMAVTRGLFMGWVRALAAVALVQLVAWLLVVLMLSVIDPWVATLNAQRLGQRLDPQTAMSAGALVFVFAFGQLALIIGAVVVAMGFRLPDMSARRDARGPAGASGQAPAGVGVIATPSRAERLAFDLQRDTAQAAARSRVATTALAAGAAPARQVSIRLDESRRLGETYRRSAVTNRRTGAAR